MSARRVGIAALLLASLTAAGCTSSGSGSSTPTPSASAISADTLAAKVRNGLANITSAHLTLDTGALGSRATGDFTFANGNTQASHLTVATGSQQVEVITVGSSSYAKLPGEGKPWTRVSADSSNGLVRNLATTLPLVEAVGSLSQLAAIIAGASDVRDKGATTLNGAPAHRYTLTVSPSAPGSGQLHDLLSRLGNKPVPVQLWLDGKGRPLRVQLALDVAGQTFPLVVTIDKYNAPVTIKAPPTDQVSGH